MRKRWQFASVFIFWILMLAGLSGCSNQEHEKLEDQSSQQVYSVIESEEPSSEFDDELSVESSTAITHITRPLSSGIQVDANVDLLEQVNFNSVPTYHAQMHVFDFDAAKDLLLAGMELTSDESSETSMSLTNSLYRYCTTADKHSLYSNGEMLAFSSQQSDKIEGLFGYFFTSEPQIANRYLNGGELDFATISEAKVYLQTFIAQLGISVIDNPSIYTLNQEALEEMAQLSAENYQGFGMPTPKIEPEDACYVFIYQIAVDGMPISMEANGVYGDGSWTSGTTLKCYITSAGVIGLKIDYQFDSIKIVSQGSILDVDGALDLLDQKYATIILEGNYLVDSMKFEYVPLVEKGSATPSYTLLPVWRFSILQTYELADKLEGSESSTIERRYTAVFNAITGEELACDAG